MLRIAELLDPSCATLRRVDAVKFRDRPGVRLSLRCALVIAATIVSARVIRVVLAGLRLSLRRESPLIALLATAAFAIVVGLIWFALILVCMNLADWRRCKVDP